MIIFTHRDKTFFRWKFVYLSIILSNLPAKLKHKYSQIPSLLTGASILIRDLNLPCLRRMVVAGQSPKYDKLLASKIEIYEFIRRIPMKKPIMPFQTFTVSYLHMLIFRDIFSANTNNICNIVIINHLSIIIV